jgi:hypothetical protein
MFISQPSPLSVMWTAMPIRMVDAESHCIQAVDVKAAVVREAKS